MSTISSWMDYPPNGFSTTLSSGLTDSGLTISLNSITGLASEGVGVIFKKDSDGDVVDTSVEFVHWTSTGTGTVICSDTGDRGIAGSYGSAAQAHDSGDYFEVWVSSQYYTSQRNGFIAEHSAAGVHDTTKVADLTTEQTLTNKTLTSPTINTPTITTPKVITAYAIGAAGAAETVNWANGDLQTMTLDENVTITFSNAVAGQRLTLFLLQDGTGTNTIAFADTIVWQDGITWGDTYYTKTANKMNVVVIYYSGSAYFGMVGKFA